MTTLRIGEDTVELEPQETVLDGLLRGGHAVPHSCRAGACQSCLVRRVEGEVPTAATAGVKDTLVAQGYFLSCMAKPASDLRVALADGAALNHRATVLHSEDIGAGVRLLRLAVPAGFEWFPGQFVTILRADGVARSYSIASLPSDGHLELHVRRVQGGVLSNWLHDVVAVGDELALRGPAGDCFYTPGDEDAELLLAGTGTGLAPLVAILRDAIARGHRGPIRLFHGALHARGLYDTEPLRAALAGAAKQVHFSPCLIDASGGVPDGGIVGPLDHAVLARFSDAVPTRAYLCGDPALVQRLRRGLFMKGLSNRRILADAFVPTAPAAGAP